MGRLSIWVARGRAAIGVVALYGLLLQAFLAATIPVIRAEPAGVLCVAHDGAGQGSPETPIRHDHACCTVAQAGTLVPSPGPIALPAWAAPSALAITWRREARTPATGPPTRAHSARGPPSA